MENDYNSYFQNYTGMEFVSRKGRGKKKKKQNTNRDTEFNNNEDVKSESEMSNTYDSVVDVNLTDERGSGVEDTEEESGKDGVNLSLSEDRSSNGKSSRVSLDGVLKLGPEYEKEDEESLKIKEIIEYQGPVEEFYPLNTRALQKDASTYMLETFEKNALIIFNQEKIDGRSPRLGTEKDVQSLTRTFENFGFEVKAHDDLTKEELFKELKTFSEKDFTDYGCVAVAVLTHGSNKGLLRAKDQQYSEIEIINHFKEHNKPTLVTKPKLIIIQACRGNKSKTQGVPVFQSGKIRKDLDEDLEPYFLPVESDLLILHSSYIGSSSHRDELYGSWFIQALCNKIDTLASTQDLESILTDVKREVAINKHYEEYNTKTFEIDINKQMPVKTSTLIRKLYLRKFGDTPIQETSADQLTRPSESRNVVLDTVSAPITPMTPMSPSGSCSCFLDHFNYMRNCLRYFVEDNPNDETAQNILDVANTFEDSHEFNTPKDKMSKAISKHLISKAQCCQFYKFMYFYKHAHSQT